MSPGMRKRLPSYNFQMTAKPGIPIRLEVSGDLEVKQEFEKQLLELGIREGAIVSFFGAFDECCISNMEPADAFKDVLTEYSEPSEISGSGEIHEGKLHIHCVLGFENDETKSGHLHWAYSKSYFTVLIVIPFEQ